jgi:hypothetical protein
LDENKIADGVGEHYLIPSGAQVLLGDGPTDRAGRRNAAPRNRRCRRSQGSDVMQSTNSDPTPATDVERRTFVGRVELRAGTPPRAASASIEGVAAVVGKETVIGSGFWAFREMIMPGAFKDAVKNDDVRALFNHDPNLCSVEPRARRSGSRKTRAVCATTPICPTR